MHVHSMPTLGNSVPRSAKSSSQDETDPDALGEGVTMGAWYWCPKSVTMGLQPGKYAGRPWSDTKARCVRGNSKTADHPQPSYLGRDGSC